MTGPSESTGPSFRVRAAAQSALGAAVVAGVFCLTVIVLMAVTALRMNAADPLHSKLLEKRVQALRDRPADEALVEEVRQLDLLARRAFFASRSFFRAGAWLLLAGWIVFFGAWKLHVRLRRELPVPFPSGGVEPPPRAWTPVQTAVTVFVVLVAVASLSIALFLPHEVPRGLPAAGRAGGVPGAETVERTFPPPPPVEAVKKNWPGFRGPFGLGIAWTGTPPLAWDGKKGENVLWKVPVPREGFSSPAVWGDRLFLTGGDKEVREVLCFDTGDGSLVWRASVDLPPGVRPPKVTEDTGYAAPSPATDGRVVCAVFATGDVICLDLEGKEVWRKHLGVPVNSYGHGSSPLIRGDVLYLQFDDGRAGRLMALNVLTGKTVWQRAREVVVSWCSPAFAEVAGEPRLLLNGNPVAVAYDAATGAEVWQVECMMGEIATSPAYAKGRVFVGNENACLVAIDAVKGEVLWEGDLDLPDVASPLATDDRLIVGSGGGIVTCYDAASGKERWIQEFPEGFWASPLLANGNVYLLDQTGVMRIFADKDDYQAIGAPALGETAVATPAIVGGRIYVRGEKSLFCIAEKKD
ncbi:MAG: PQQ-like beta-propeller repeat protein [Planctomycetota bacterium]|jgi:outer membrane protein assembly factor BamB